MKLVKLADCVRFIFVWVKVVRSTFIHHRLTDMWTVFFTHFSLPTATLPAPAGQAIAAELPPAPSAVRERRRASGFYG